MADLAQLERALINADAAGDAAAARQLAQAIIQLRKGGHGIEKPASDPTQDMGTGERLLAGIGKGFADAGRGLGQLVGAVSREDIEEARRLDEPLMNTTAGKVGNFGGNLALLAPTALIPGAATLRGAAGIGALTGLAAPSVSTEETLKNTALGGALGAGGQIVGRAVGAGWNALGGLVAPFTGRGQESVAANTLRAFASDPAKAAANLRSARQLVPGSIPTMAQGADDAGLAQLERTLANNPETGKLIEEAYAAQRAARLGAIQGLAGDATKREAAEAARKAASGPLYQQATNAVYQVDDQLANLLNRPVVAQAMNRAKALAENQGRRFQFATESVAPFRGVGGAQMQQSRQITGQGLQDLKMALDDMLMDPASGIAGSEVRNVQTLRGQMVDWMERANPDFKAARQTYAKESVPINTMDVADALMKKLEPALARYGANTQEHAAAYARALEAAKETVKKQTGINKPMGDVIDKKAATLLDDIARDLGRKVNAENMGRAKGSNTAQNLSAQNLLRRTLGPTGLNETWAEAQFLQSLLSPYTGAAKLAGAERNVMGLLADAATNPQRAAGLLSMAQTPSRASLFGQRLLPYASPLSLSSGLLAPPAQ